MKTDTDNFILNHPHMNNEIEQKERNLKEQLAESYVLEEKPFTHKEYQAFLAGFETARKLAVDFIDYHTDEMEELSKQIGKLGEYDGN